MAVSSLLSAGISCDNRFTRFSFSRIAFSYSTENDAANLSLKYWQIRRNREYAAEASLEYRLTEYFHPFLKQLP